MFGPAIPSHCALAFEKASFWNVSIFALVNDPYIPSIGVLMPVNANDSVCASLTHCPVDPT